MSLVEHVAQNINATHFYEWIFPEVAIQPGENRMSSPWVDDKTPSLMVNATTGAWNHFCGTDEDHFGGPTIVSFYKKLEDISETEAAKFLFDKFIHRTIPHKRVKGWMKKLKKTPSIMKFLLNDRMLTKEFIELAEYGWDGERVTIPLKNEYGIYVNIKRYDTAPGSKVKMLNYSDGKKKMKPGSSPSVEMKFGSPTMLYPLDVFTWAYDAGYIVVCEGEHDTNFLRSIGIPACTSSHGSSSWPKQYTNKFKGLDVIVIYDNDSAGKIHWKKYVLKNLSKVAKSIKNIEPPKYKMPGNRFSKDVLDWAKCRKGMLKKSAWLRRFKKAKVVLKNDHITDSNDYEEIEEITLDKASNAINCNKRLRVKAIVSGKFSAPYMLPRKYRVTCNKNNDCQECPLKEYQKDFQEKVIKENDPMSLQLIGTSLSQQHKMLISMAGFEPTNICDCAIKMDILESFNIEQLQMIPTLDSDSIYTVRTAYVIGHGITPNVAYEFDGIITPHPQTQQVVHLIDKSKPLEGEIDTFQMTPDLCDQLKVFQPGKKKVLGKLMELAEWKSRHITKIKERPELHIAIDLVFHSVKAFRFNKENVDKAMLDVLILGDTRTGKGFVASGLSKYYKLGTLASAENCSFAGLVGGIDKIKDQFFVKWGLLPMNNNKMAIIDEGSALSPEDWAKLSRIRSEGIAEMTKIITEVAQANVRLLTLANPRSGRPIMSYNSGVEAVKELIGANEDISRFDYVFTVASDEVSSEIINTLNTDEDTKDEDKYPPELCKQLILWAWSRTKDQVEFTEGCEKYIIKQAIKFGKTYSSTIPLIQSENIRIKIAKGAAAVAACVFSCDKSGDTLIVKTEHVRAFCQTLDRMYEKDSMNYKLYSEYSHADASMVNSKELAKAFSGYETKMESIISGMLTLTQITADSLSDYIEGEPQAAKMLISQLVQVKCLKRVGKFYVKDSNFVVWLRTKERDLKEEKKENERRTAN